MILTRADTNDPGKAQPWSTDWLVRRNPKVYCLVQSIHFPGHSMQGSTSLLVTPRLFEQILETEGNLVGIETPHVDDALEQFRQLAMRGGQAVYLWDPENGITALRQTEMRVPGSKRFSDAMRFILQSMQFGVYLLVDYEDQIKSPNTALLRRFAKTRTGNQRKIVFVTRKLVLPEEIDSLVERLSPMVVSTEKPRLRDGRWVR